jgi:hypothetical protein
MKHNNSAGRLHSLLVQANRYDIENQTAIQVWSEVLGLGRYDSEESEGAVVSRFGQLIQLYKETIAELEAIDGLDRELFLVWARPVRSLLYYSSLHRTWRSQRGALSEDVLRALAFCADRLAQLPSQERDVDENELRSLSNQVADLEESILSSGLPPDIKELLFRLAVEISNALAEYRIRGAKRLLEATEVVAGGLLMHRWREVNDSVPAKDSALAAKLATAWRALVDLVTLATGVQQLGPGVMDRVRGFLDS